MNMLFIGDVVGKGGREAVKQQFSRTAFKLVADGDLVGHRTPVDDRRKVIHPVAPLKPRGIPAELPVDGEVLTAQLR